MSFLPFLYGGVDIISTKKSAKIVVVLLLSAFGLILVIGVVFFVMGGNKKAKTIADVLGADIIIVPKTAAKYAPQFVVADDEKPLYLPSGIYEKLRNEPEIARLTYHVHLGKPPSDCCTYIDGPIIAFEEKNDFILTPLIAERRKKGPLAQHEILEGGAIHDYLGLITDILLFNNNIKIAGHLRHSGTNFDNCVFMPVAGIETIPHESLPDYPQGGISVIFVQLSADSNVSEFAAKIKKSYPAITTILKGSLFQGMKVLL